MPRSVYIGSVGGGGAPEGFSNATRYDDAADLAANGPSATGSGSFVLVDDGESGRPRVYRDGGTWAPVNDAAAYASYAAAKADIANIGAGDYVVTPSGMYFVAASGSDRYLLPAEPYGPGGGWLTGATRLGVWAASGDNSDLGDFTQSADSGTNSIADDGSLVTISAGGASATGRAGFQDQTLGASDTKTLTHFEDFEITAAPAFAGTFSVCQLWFEAYLNASDRIFSYAYHVPGTYADTWGIVLADSGGTTQVENSLIAVPDGGSGVDLWGACDASTDRLWALRSSDDAYPSVADLNGAARSFSTRQARQGSALGSPYRCFFDVGNTSANGVSTIRFSSVSTWRLTLA